MDFADFKGLATPVQGRGKLSSSRPQSLGSTAQVYSVYSHVGLSEGRVTSRSTQVTLFLVFFPHCITCLAKAYSLLSQGIQPAQPRHIACAAKTYSLSRILHTVPKPPEGVVIGFQNFTLAPKSQKQNDSKQQQKIVARPPGGRFNFFIIFKQQKEVSQSSETSKEV